MPRKGDEIVSSIGLLPELMRFFEISYEDALRVAVHPDDHDELVIDHDLSVVVTVASYGVGARLSGLIEYQHTGPPRLVHVFHVPGWLSAERSPLGVFRALCNECGVTMRIGDKLSKLLIHQRYRGTHLTRENFLGDVTAFRRISSVLHFKRLDDSNWVIGFTYGIKWEVVKNLL